MNVNMNERQSGRQSPIVDTTAVRKTLFMSPSSDTDTITTAAPNTKLMMYRLQIDQDTDTCVKQMEKENHETALKDLRNLGKELSETDWQYDSIGKFDST